MTELQVISLIIGLLLARLFSCQDSRNIYLCRGNNYRPDPCRATFYDSRVYWKLNDSNIYSDSEAYAFGLNITLGHDDAGRMYWNLIAYNVQYPMTLSCVEGENETSYSIQIRDVCDPPSVTDSTYSLNLTTQTTASKSCDKKCVITAAVMVTVLVVGTVTAIAVAIICCKCRYRCQRNRFVNDVERQQPDENNRLPPGGHDNNSGDGDNDSSRDGQGPFAPVAPEDVTKGTMHRLPGRPVRYPPRLSNSRIINGQRGPQANSTPESTVDVKVQFGIVENNDGTRDVTTAGKQCTDESGIDPIFCYKDEIHVRGSVDISSYKKATYRVNPQTLRCEEMLTV